MTLALRFAGLLYLSCIVVLKSYRRAGALSRVFLRCSGRSSFFAPSSAAALLLGLLLFGGISDMYPLYWTPSRGGIIMRYTYEYKRKCVELYREGKWPETPEGVSDKSFRDKVRLWVRAEDSRGPEALKHKNFNRNWTPEERLELVSQVMSGKSCVSVAIEAGIQDRLLYQWVQNYKTKGYNGLVEMKKGRPSKGVPQMKKEEARPLNESEREELIRLRAENEYIKAENEVIKKEIALREERHAAQLKARKQRSSKSCVKKDTN